MRRIDHLTPRYIYNRLSVILDEKLHPNHPWLTKQSVSLLDTLLSSQDIGVEFGSGRSTKWFLNKLNHLTSIESDKDWYNKIGSELGLEIKNGRLDYQFAETEQEYSSIINKFKDDSIDFALVDGKHRDLCANLMVNKVKVGGLLVVDNVNWFIPNNSTQSPNSQRSTDGCSSEGWEKFVKSVEGWRLIWTSNGVWDTSIWIRK